MKKILTGTMLFVLLSTLAACTGDMNSEGGFKSDTEISVVSREEGSGTHIQLKYIHILIGY